MPRMANWLFAPLSHWKVATLSPLNLLLISRNVNLMVVRRHTQPVYVVIYVVDVGGLFLVLACCWIYGCPMSLATCVVIIGCRRFWPCSMSWCTHPCWRRAISLCIVKIPVYSRYRRPWCSLRYRLTSCDALVTMQFCEVSLLEVDVVGTSNETWIIVSWKGCVS